MKRRIIVGIIAILLIGLVLFLLIKLSNKDDRTNAELDNIVNKVYENISEDIKSKWEGISTTPVDLNDMEAVEYNTGLTSLDGIESISVSETSDKYYSYSFVCIKPGKEANVEIIKNNVYSNMDMYKWKYVYAKKLAVVDVGGYIYAAMGTHEEVDSVVNSLKSYAQNNKLTIGNILERIEE